jgi:hypothetical protein
MRIILCIASIMLEIHNEFIYIQLSHFTNLLPMLLLLLLRGKAETPDIENLGSVLRDSSIQTLRLRLPTIGLFSPMVTQVRQRDFYSHYRPLLWLNDDDPLSERDHCKRVL